MTEDDPTEYYVQLCDPSCIIVVRPSERLQELLEEEDYTEVDADCWHTHRRAYPVGDE